MHLVTRNVNTAFYTLVEGIHYGRGGNRQVGNYVEAIPTTRTTSRNGDVLQIPEPVVITYKQPRERVLFNKARDCNPFFHLFESIWMLAGSDSVHPVAFFAPNMRNYSDNGQVLRGAYGYRWRNRSFCFNIFSAGGPYNDTCDIDQLSILIEHLQQTPDSRRAVLQMWNVEDDLLCAGIGDSVCSKDLCCNLSACFSIRKEQGNFCDTLGDSHDSYLDMTVFNRSNDLIWGCLGANAVHFSMLQEYMACALGIQVGVYNQISNNLHVYTNNWKPEEWLRDKEHADCYPQLGSGPLFLDREQFDKECIALVNVFDAPELEIGNLRRCLDTVALASREPFIASTVIPMCRAFIWHKQRDYKQASLSVGHVIDPDWQRAGVEWLQRREASYRAKAPMT